MLYDRNIICGQGAGGSAKGVAEASPHYDNYYSRLLKLIPAELVAFWLGLDAVASNIEGAPWLSWALLGVTLIGAWFYLARVTNVVKIGQRIITLVALCIWVFVMGGPFVNFSWYNADYGKLLVVLYTFFMPVFYQPEA